MVLRAAAAVVLSAALAGVPAQEQAPNRRSFTVVVRGDQFVPSRLEVSQDDLVRITFTSDDRPASFALDAYRISKRAGSGQTITFEFRADQPGTFTFYCNLSDERCRNMKGTLVVKGK